MEHEGDIIAGWLPVLADIGALVNSGAALPDVLQAIARTACELMGIDFCAVALPDEGRTLLRFEGAYGLSAEYIEQVNSTKPIRITDAADAAPSSQAFLRGEAVQIVDTMTHPAFSSWSGVGEEQGFASMVSIPLIAAGDVLGILNCYTSARHDFDQEIPLLAMLADQAAVSIASATLREHQQEAIRRLNKANWNLERQYELQRQAAEIHDRLTALSLEGGGALSLAESLSELLGRPIVIRSMAGEPLHSTTPEPDVVAPLVVPPSDEGDPGAAPSETSRVDSEAGVINAPVVLQGETVAWICAPGPVSALGPLDLRAIEHTSTVLALELLRSRTAAEAEWRSSDEVLASLIRDGADDLRGLFDRARRLGHGLGEVPHTLVVMHRDNPQREISRLRLAEAFRELSKDAVHKPMLGMHNDAFVVLWPEDPASPLDAQAIVDSVRRACGISAKSGARVLSAATRLTLALDSFPRNYRIVRGTAELAAVRGLADGVYRPDDLGVVGLFLQFDDIREMDRYVRSILAPITAYDEQYGSDLLTTLTVLLENDLNASTTAVALYIHKNTVAQRRHRIEDLLQRSLNRTWDLAEIAIAVRIQQMITSLPPPSPGRGCRHPLNRDDSIRGTPPGT